MSIDWEFYLQTPTGPINNPITGEFFSTEAVGNVAESLIREGIQNTLDARKKSPDGSSQPAHARIFLSDTTAALRANRSQRWFGNLWPHVMSPGNGLRNQPDAGEPCPFLVFEDFGTTGLTGDAAEYQVVNGAPNNFLNFFRAEGHSDKGVQDGGSWGVGKTVFPRASRISSFFGLTVREDDGAHLLLGRSILRYHRVGKISYTSNGYFGSTGKNGLMLPTDDARTLEEFRNDFRIKRQSESGLSIVVPWYEVIGDDSLNREKVIAAVLRGFFYPILAGHLAVTIATPKGELTLHASNIEFSIDTIGGELARKMLPLIRLAEWAKAQNPAEISSLVPPTDFSAQNWSIDLIPTGLIENIRQAISEKRRIALRVPMHVRTKTGDPEKTFFDVFIEHSDEQKESPVFIRDELIISDVKSPRTSQIRSIVIVEDRPLAALLRDAETPAHTEWNTGTSKFKNKYTYGPAVIKFVRESVSKINHIINEADQKPDPTITIDFFSVSAQDNTKDAVPGRKRKPRNVAGQGPTLPPMALPLPGKRRFRISRLLGGFAIRAGDRESAVPSLIDIRVAYDVRHGNPLHKYHEADFDLGRLPVRYDTKLVGAEVKSTDGNQMLVAVNSREFNVDVTGFDPNRDIYVKAIVKESVDAD